VSTNVLAETISATKRENSAATQPALGNGKGS
jgi:predicted nucleic acid-binding protein